MAAKKNLVGENVAANSLVDLLGISGFNLHSLLTCQELLINTSSFTILKVFLASFISVKQM